MSVHFERFHPAVFSPLDIGQIQTFSPEQVQELALTADRLFYARSDADFHARRQSLWESKRAAEAQLLREMNGDFDPDVDASLVRTGLGQALTEFGGSGGVPPGSIGSFAVAKDIGLNYLLLQQNARQKLRVTNQLNPARRFGIDGATALKVLLDRDLTYNQVHIANFKGANETSISNAINEFQYNMWTFQHTPQDESFWHRILNGAVTGAYEGYTYGSYGGPVAGIYGAVFGALGGAFDGGINGYIYQLHTANNSLYLGSTGWNGMTYNNGFTYGG